MSDLKMQKYYDREYFDTDEKYNIIKKAIDNEKCCHCGKLIFVGHGMTVDHFIPLNKGGSNRYINLIPLCKECNDNKDDKLYTIDYLKYIKPKYKKELQEYLDSYVEVTEYVQRRRLLAYDEYDFDITIPTKDFKKKHQIRSSSKGVKVSYKLKLATWDDFENLCEYLKKYLKKYQSLDSFSAVIENITFWMNFGCIYYIERDNEIKVMIAITIKQMATNCDFRGIQNHPYLFVFPYYMTDLTYNITSNVIYHIGHNILEENHLDFIPINISMLKTDHMLKPLAMIHGNNLRDSVVSTFSDFSFLAGHIESKTNEFVKYEDMTESEKKTYDFMNKFDDILDKMIEYFSKYADSGIGWMISNILPAERIIGTELEHVVNYEKED